MAIAYCISYLKTSLLVVNEMVPLALPSFTTAESAPPSRDNGNMAAAWTAMVSASMKGTGMSIRD